jgi:hypothetical protein
MSTKQKYEAIELYENPSQFLLVGLLPSTKDNDVKKTYQDYSNVVVINRQDEKASPQRLVIDGQNSIFKEMKTMTKIYALLGTISLISGKFLLAVTQRELIGVICEEKIYRITKIQFIPYIPAKFRLQEQQVKDREIEYMGMINKILVEDRAIYFAYKWDLTHRFQNQQRLASNELFFWNHYLSKEFVDFPQFVIPMIRGLVEIGSCRIGSKSFTFGLITRTGCKRAGTRYNVRGADREGHVANYCETEQFIEYDGILTSYVQIRGSIPLLWSQEANLKYTPEIRYLNDKLQQKEAFQKHFNLILGEYAPRATDYGVVCINLCREKGQEQTLSEVYKKFWKNFASEKVQYITFDFHHECKNLDFTKLRQLIKRLDGSLKAMKFYARRFAESKDSNTWNTLTRSTSVSSITEEVDQSSISRNSSTELLDFDLSSQPTQQQVADLLQFDIDAPVTTPSVSVAEQSLVPKSTGMELRNASLFDPFDSDPFNDIVSNNQSNESNGTSNQNAFDTDPFGSDPFSDALFENFEKEQSQQQQQIEANSLQQQQQQQQQQEQVQQITSLQPVSDNGILDMQPATSNGLPPVPKHIVEQIKKQTQRQVSYQELERQCGVCRINCIDCCDRTNITATYVSRAVLLEQMYMLGICKQREEDLSKYPKFESLFNNFWTNNGDRISILYTGTSALMNDYTRTGQRSVQGVLTDGFNSAKRYLQNNFKDNYRQRGLNLVLGLLNLESEEEINASRSTDLVGELFLL